MVNLEGPTYSLGVYDPAHDAATLHRGRSISAAKLDCLEHQNGASMFDRKFLARAFSFIMGQEGVPPKARFTSGVVACMCACFHLLAASNP